jgi:hypothetical protein
MPLIPGIESNVSREVSRSDSVDVAALKSFPNREAASLFFG